MQDNLNHQNIILTYLNDPENETLIQQVSEFRAQSEDNELYFKQIEKIWNASANLKPLYELNSSASVQKLSSRLIPHTLPKTKHNYLWLRIAAAIVLVSALSVWIYSEKFSVQELVKETTNQVDSVVLSDGSKIMLAKNSAIKFPDRFKGKTREISLLSGEAFFKVHRDPKHPFQVAIGHSKVSVLGTSFNIHYSKTKINVSVKTGKVSFLPNSVSRPSILIAGQAISYNLKENTVEKLDGANANAWLTKELHFVDMPLNKVCEELSSYYGVKIVLQETIRTAKKFNANFKGSSLEEVLTVLNETYKIQINKRDSLITIKSK
ncbi:FecR family protein [Pedobacter nutrimenti]|uniref:FecR family protein n=1 Tax=Pedobacter nutrimenti TaxID=1241337 RepID=UPI00292DA10B|nr:FecR domain-containing protein [Pedobacter nutrimenti]